MKGLISGIKRMEIHDGDGLRTTVFFKGCPLKCIWCHNPESISFDSQFAFFKEKCISCGICKNIRDEHTAGMCPAEAIVRYGREYDSDELVAELLADKMFFEKSGGGVTLSGGECLCQAEFAVEVAKKLFANNVSVYVDTCGFVNSSVLDDIMPYTDKFLFDIKAVDSELHKKCTGRDNKIILDNLKYLSDNNCSIEIRYPLVMGYNDSECERIAELLKDLKGVTKVKVLRYHSLAGSRYEALDMANTMPQTETSKADVMRVVQKFRSRGINSEF